MSSVVTDVADQPFEIASKIPVERHFRARLNSADKSSFASDFSRDSVIAQINDFEVAKPGFSSPFHKFDHYTGTCPYRARSDPPPTFLFLLPSRF